MNKASIENILVSLLLFCSVSCSEKVEGLITTFTIRPDKEAYQSVAVSDLVSSVEHIRISSVSANFSPGERVIYTRGKYYLTDRNDASVVILNAEGEMLQTINRRGRKTDEYVSFSDYDVNPSNGEISVYDATSSKILVYSEKGEFLRRIVFDRETEWPRSFVSLEDGSYLCYLPEYDFPSIGPVPRRGLWRTADSGEFMDYLLTFKDEYKFVQFRTTGYFSRLSDGTISLVGEEDKDYIYHISPDGMSLEPAYHFRFDRKIPARLLTRSPEELSLSDRFYYKYWFRETDGWILLTTIFFPENTACHFFYNKRIQKAYVVTDKNELIDDMGINGLGMNAAPDSLMKTDYDEAGLPEIVVAYLK